MQCILMHAVGIDS